MRLYLMIVAVPLASITFGGQAVAWEKGNQQPAKVPAQINLMLSCRGIAETAARLSCYDTNASMLADAVKKRDIVMVDRDGVRNTKKSLFGFSVRDLDGLFGDDGEDVDQLEATVLGSSLNPDGAWSIAFDNGQTWVQSDMAKTPIQPRKGEKALIRKAMLGSYFIQVGKRNGFRARRVR